MRKVITGWKMITPANVALYYNGGGDALYAKKLGYTLSLVRKSKGATCGT